MARRIVKIAKIVGWVVVVLLLVVAAVAFWFVRRPWPQVDGSVTLAGLGAPVEVVRDRWGVPHLFAKDDDDLLFAQGYVHAQDRLWQMELNRTLANGRLAAVLGPAVLDTDRMMRTYGFRRAAEEDWAALDPGARKALESYARGVNAFIEGHRDRLPLEFTLLGVTPQPWTPLDSLAWTKLMSMALSLNLSREAMRYRFGKDLGALAADAAERLMPAYPADAPAVIPHWPAAAPDGPAGGGPAPPSTAGAPGTAARRMPPQSAAPAPAGEVSRYLRETLESALGRGSNGWVVAGSRTAGGRPLLANDTHLGVGMPSVWYENALTGGRFDVVGFSFPGLPGVVIGRNRRIAWGITSLAADIQDLYFERFDDADHPQRYAFGDGWRDLQFVDEEIEVKGAEPVTQHVVLTHHGPIVNGLFDELADAPPAALSWTVLRGNTLMRALLDLDAAGDWAGFRRALAEWGSPAVSFLYADADGNVGYQAVGELPRRAPGHDGTVAMPGWGGEYEWQGFIPFAEMPAVLNPAAGYAVAANNKTVGEGYPYVIAHDWADPHRARRITELLAADSSVSVEDVEHMQADTKSLLAQDLRPYLLAVEPASDLEKQALAAFRDWDLRYEPDRVGASVFHLWQWFLLKNVVADELGEKLFEDYRGLSLLQHSVTAQLMADPADPWLDDRTTPEIETREEIAHRSLADAVAWLSEHFGPDPAGWQWGRLHPVTLVHTPLGQSGIGPLEAIFNSETLPARGGPFTVDAGTPSIAHPFAMIAGSSQRFIADLADPDATLAVNSTGECAQAFHRHREDMVRLWQEVGYHPLPLSRDKIEVEATLTLTPP
jgi:penicillin G amidase